MFPFHTDAPIYHWPYATVGLVVANVAVFALLLGADPDVVSQGTLAYGSGLRPLQWITSNFIHANAGHLVGNMVYLWAFGLVVEGKLGAWRFLLVYLGIGAAECALEQSIMLGADGGHSLGASAVIYGLLAMALVWAPRNEFSCLVTWGFRVDVWDIPIVTFAAIYFLLEAITVGLSRLAVGSSMLHLAGAAIGFVLATWMVKTNLVDCEGWDLYSVGARGRPTTSAAARKKKRDEGRGDSRREREEGRSAESLAALRAAIEAGEAHEAFAHYQHLATLPDGYRPLETDLRALIGLMQRAKLTAESVPVMEQYVARHPDGAPRVRLKLAQILVRDQQRPAAALRVLADLPESDLPDDLVPVRREVERLAHQQRDDGVLELEGGSW